MFSRSLRLWASGVSDYKRQLQYHLATPLEDRLKHHCSKFHDSKVDTNCLACKDMLSLIDKRDHAK